MFETAIIERYRRRESSVEEALIEMYLAGVSVRWVEDPEARLFHLELNLHWRRYDVPLPCFAPPRRGSTPAPLTDVNYNFAQCLP